MSLPPETEAAVRDVARARLVLKQAVERLKAELPNDVADEIHYNGQNANIPAAYRPVLLTLRPEGQG